MATASPRARRSASAGRDGSGVKDGSSKLDSGASVGSSGVAVRLAEGTQPRGRRERAPRRPRAGIGTGASGQGSGRWVLASWSAVGRPLAVPFASGTPGVRTGALGAGRLGVGGALPWPLGTPGVRTGGWRGRIRASRCPPSPVRTPGVPTGPRQPWRSVIAAGSLTIDGSTPKTSRIRSGVRTSAGGPSATIRPASMQDEPREEDAPRGPGRGAPRGSSCRRAR